MKTPLARLFSKQRRHCLFSDRSPKDRNAEKLILPHEFMLERFIFMSLEHKLFFLCFFYLSLP